MVEYLDEDTKKRGTSKTKGLPEGGGSRGGKTRDTKHEAATPTPLGPTPPDNGSYYRHVTPE